MKEMKKFNNIADIYDKYRPSYPEELISDIVKKSNLNQNSVIADIGAGTGILTQKLIHNQTKVVAVEPNEEMRAVLEKKFKENNNFYAIDGSAENTKIESGSIDLITVAQAFHWFDIDKFYKECKRILKVRGKIFILWNKLNIENEIVKQMKEIDYEYTNQYKEIDIVLEKNETDNKLKEFFRNEKHKKIIVNNDIQYDLDSFIGYNLSKSYSLRKNDINYLEYVKAFEKLFEKYQQNGIINISNYVYGYFGEL